jgi:hypothetical protein
VGGCKYNEYKEVTINMSYNVGQTVNVKWYYGLEEIGAIKKIANIRSNETTYFYSIEENGKKGTACFTSTNIKNSQVVVKVIN